MNIRVSLKASERFTEGRSGAQRDSSAERIALTFAASASGSVQSVESSAVLRHAAAQEMSYSSSAARWQCSTMDGGGFGGASRARSSASTPAAASATDTAIEGVSRLSMGRPAPGFL